MFTTLVRFTSYIDRNVLKRAKGYVFMTGAASMGLLGLGAGFVRSQVPLIVLRALMGIGAPNTIHNDTVLTNSCFRCFFNRSISAAAHRFAIP